MTSKPPIGGSGGPPPDFAVDWCFFLDVDGTLLDIAITPGAVQVDRDLSVMLDSLKRAADGALALISGRALADLDRLFAPTPPVAAGEHGAERRDAFGTVHRRAARRELLHVVAGRLETFAAAHPGMLFEDKGASLALHFRQVPHQAGAARDAIVAALRMLGGVYEMQIGKLVLEIKPTGYDKGSAIEDYMQEAPFAGRVPVFIGDDLTDEYGFCMVNALGGHSLKVGAGPSQARAVLPDAAAVRAWLAAWIEFAQQAGQYET